MNSCHRILIFIENFALPTYTFIYSEIQYLAKKNTVLILTTNRINKTSFNFENVIVAPFYGGSTDYKIRKTLRSNDFLIGSKKCSFQSTIKRTVNQFKPDVIHCHFGFESWLFLNNFPLNDKIPIFLHFHGFDASHKLKSKRYCKNVKLFFCREDLFPIFVSKHMYLTVQSALQQSIKKWYLLYYGTDCSFFIRSQTKNIEQITFLQISSFAEKKGHVYTLRAFKKFSDRNHHINCKLILAGEGSQKEHVLKHVNELKIQDKVFFPGLVDRQQAKLLMQNANYFVHHSITSKIGDTEGIPNAIMEAMAMELPIISTYHAGIPELVEDGVNGLLVQEKDVDAYADAMEKILTWGYLPQNRTKIDKYFEKEKHGALLESYYKEAIEEMKKKNRQLT